MESEEKPKLAKLLIQITAIARGSTSSDLPEEIRVEIDEMRNQHDQVYAALYAEHFSTEQLQSQIRFYQSDFGRSILKVRKMIQEKFPERLAQFNNMEQDNEEGMTRLRISRIDGSKMIPMKKKGNEEET